MSNYTDERILYTYSPTLPLDDVIINTVEPCTTLTMITRIYITVIYVYRLKEIIGSFHGVSGLQWNHVLWRGKVGGGESFGNGWRSHLRWSDVEGLCSSDSRGMTMGGCPPYTKGFVRWVGWGWTFGARLVANNRFFLQMRDFPQNSVATH